MAKTSSVTRNQTHDEASSTKRVKTRENGGGVPWSDIDHDVLYLVMMRLGVVDFHAFRTVCKSWRSLALSTRMRFKTCDNGGVASWSDINHEVLFFVTTRLGVIDFIAFSGACKSWRSLALSYRKRFMASRPPMSMSISIDANMKKCYLEDFQGRKFRTIIPHSAGRKCIGLTCGYLILFGRKTNDFWLVNPITRHQLRFPYVPFDVDTSPLYLGIKAILVFSPSVSRWLFAIIEKNRDQIWFLIAGKRVWNRVSTTSHILDIHAFKGKIYTLNFNYHMKGVGHLCEMRLGPEPKLILLETKNFPRSYFLPEFVRSSGNLYGKRTFSNRDSFEAHQLDFGEMKWVFREKTMEEYAFFSNYMSHNTAAKRKSWWAGGTDKRQKGTFLAKRWYFPHDCLNVNLLDE